MCIEQVEIERFLVRKNIQSLGDQCLSLDFFSDGHDCLRLLESNPPTNETVILVNLRLGGPGLCGFEFVTAFEDISVAVREKCAIVMMMLSDTEEYYQQVEAPPSVAGILVKPISPIALAQILKTL
jgi:hypothetical protein